MGKRRYFRRYYRKRKKFSSFEYLKTKIEYVDLISWKNAPDSYVMFDNASTFSVDLSDVLSQTVFNTMKGLFTYFKIYAFSYESIPSPSNTNGTINISNIKPVFVLVDTGSSNNDDVSVLRQNNASLMLDPNVRQRKFVRLQGGISAYTPCSGTPAGQIIVKSTAGGTTANSPQWQIKITFYIIFKKTRI